MICIEARFGGTQDKKLTTCLLQATKLGYSPWEWNRHPSTATSEHAENLCTYDIRIPIHAGHPETPVVARHISKAHASICSRREYRPSPKRLLDEVLSCFFFYFYHFPFRFLRAKPHSTWSTCGVSPILPYFCSRCSGALRYSSWPFRFDASTIHRDIFARCKKLCSILPWLALFYFCAIFYFGWNLLWMQSSSTVGF